MKLSNKIIGALVAAALAMPFSLAYADAASDGVSVNLSTSSAKSIALQSSQKVTLAKSASASNRSGLVKSGSHYYYYKSGKKVKSSWKTIKGKRYYFKSNGRAATGAFKVKKTYYVFSAKGVLQRAAKNVKVVKVGSNRYLVDTKGRAVKGWQVISGKLYYASASGKCAKSRTVDKIPFNSLGYAKPTNIRTKLMIEARTIVSKITNDKMTQYEKLVACWDYVYGFRWGVVFPPNSVDETRLKSTPSRLKKDWQFDWALKTFDSRILNCWGLTCGFNALAKALGEKPYIMFDNENHVWSRVNGKHWDCLGNIKGGDSSAHEADSSLTTLFW